MKEISIDPRRAAPRTSQYAPGWPSRVSPPYLPSYETKINFLANKTILETWISLDACHEVIQMYSNAFLHWEIKLLYLLCDNQYGMLNVQVRGGRGDVGPVRCQLRCSAAIRRWSKPVRPHCAHHAPSGGRHGSAGRKVFSPHSSTTSHTKIFHGNCYTTSWMSSNFLKSRETNLPYGHHIFFLEPLALPIIKKTKTNRNNNVFFVKRKRNPKMNGKMACTKNWTEKRASIWTTFGKVNQETMEKKCQTWNGN